MVQSSPIDVVCADDVHMSDQLAVGLPITTCTKTNEAKGPDLGTLADHGAVFHPGGGVDLTHQAILLIKKV